MQIDELRSVEKKSAAEYTSRKTQLAKQQQCLDAREQLEILKTRLPVYSDIEGKFHAAWEFDTYKGERKYLNNTVRTLDIKRTKKLIAKHCQNPDNSEEQAKSRKQWIRSESCAAAREDLKAIRKPQARATDEAIEVNQ